LIGQLIDTFTPQECANWRPPKTSSLWARFHDSLFVVVANGVVGCGVRLGFSISMSA
jgi:hypothetical protein